MKENSIEENIEILEKFKNNEMQRDKLERDGRCGGWKIGDIYKCLELDNAIDNILSDYKRVLKELEEKTTILLAGAEKVKQLEKENAELKEYIAIAPNLDEMTATKYRNIQQDAYIQGRAKEQQRAEQIIYKNYISKQKIKDKIEELNKEIKNCDTIDAIFKIKQQQILQELLDGSDNNVGSIESEKN